ncbi:hypothetical protein AB0D08_21405 [Kitasatospora sp. NPDC048540]|uniref:hypothetical protein n=1 Tax=unclassified Kitasatospora TaxID=2633591 RepID=UPI00053B4CBB|nr:hypothetical protein [Kitasatospora sp. MBT63]
MAVERENVEQLQEWLAEGSPQRGANPAAGILVERLAALVFQDEWAWPECTDRVDTYLDALRGRLARDGAGESRFVELTGPGADPGVFVDWFLPVVLGWERERTAQDGTGGGDGTDCWPNPNHDGTPGTEFYRIEEGTGQYLYAAGTDADDWTTYDRRRYAEPVRDDAYGLDYRYDRRDEAYEWYDEESQTWNDQTWADLYAARRHDPGSQTPVEHAEALWDENWQMFYRIGPGGVYEFADAVARGERSSGPGEIWLSHEQVLLRDAQDTADQATREAFLDAVASGPGLPAGGEELLAAEFLKLLEDQR